MLANNNMNWKLNLEKRTILILAVFSLMIVAILIAVIIPTISYIKGLNTETESLRQYLEKKYEANHTLSSSKQKIEELKIATADYENYLFFKGDELKLITALEDLATDFKLSQKINSSDLDKPSGDYVRINLTLSGNYQNLLQYFSALEKQKYFIHTENLQLFSGFTLLDNNKEAAVLNLDLVLYATKR